ncbi:uncharacterized protein SPPG_08618 [Spizellomyces punctatus DAOM BR117]|uniref:Sister chromatid cohesion protein n=1 Tax=Spizellomyces punctatus (strain DAOM BR117) TaxID=645134 RepID=A0A0L0H5N1_SPIPD|nr:uncharacterized protein SPPG_08618 [Spizellomyces punctatus DAOM BR117]KNC96023.1 hypothetical protein SPPG_08618 [Spizellomyces punctatus DAOM BR117]|eukprot:XP_016604063.1 hypothetical protein SPPG_08618 [Spizellomyces punctatus DAOM BR117]
MQAGFLFRTESFRPPSQTDQPPQPPAEVFANQQLVECPSGTALGTCTDVVGALRAQPLAPLTPAIDAANLLPDLTLLKLLPRSLLDDTDCNAVMKRIDGMTLPVVQDLIGNVDISYLRLRTSSFALPHRRHTLYQQRGGSRDGDPPALAQNILNFSAMLPIQRTQSRANVDFAIPRTSIFNSQPSLLQSASILNSDNASEVHPLVETAQNFVSHPAYIGAADSATIEYDKEVDQGSLRTTTLPTPSPVFLSRTVSLSQRRLSDAPSHQEQNIIFPPTPKEVSGVIMHDQSMDGERAVVGRNVRHAAGPMDVTPGHHEPDIPAMLDGENSTPRGPGSIKRRRTSFAEVQVLIDAKRRSFSPATAVPNNTNHNVSEYSQHNELDSKDPLSPALKKRKRSVNPESDDQHRVADQSHSLKRCSELIESLLAAEDCLLKESEVDEGTSLFFDRGGLVTCGILTELNKYLIKLDTVNDILQLIEEVGRSSMKRLSKIVEARVKDAEYLDPGFGNFGRLRATKQSKKISGEEHDGGTSFVGASPNMERTSGNGISEEDYGRHFGAAMTRIETSLDACLTAFLLLSREGRTPASDKGAVDTIFSEDLTLSCLNLLKTQLNQTLYAALQLMTREGDELTSDVQRMRAGCDRIKLTSRLAVVVVKITRIMDRMCDCLDMGVFGDDLVITVAFIALSPFFAEGAAFGNAIGLDKLQLRGIYLSRTIFGRYAKHRNFMLEEICGNCSKLGGSKKISKQFKLADGTSVQMVTALVLQLVQSCCLHIALEQAAKDLLRRSSETSEDSAKVQLRTTTSQEEKRSNMATDDVHVEGYSEEQGEWQSIEKFSLACKSGIDAASHCAHYFLRFLLNRCTQPTCESLTPKVERGRGARKGQSSNDAEYKAFLDGFLQDLLVMLNTPEWPAAELLSMIFSRLAVQVLDDVKRQGDTAIRAMAVEWLGAVCAKIRAQPFKHRQAGMPEILLRLPSADLTPDTSVSSVSALRELQNLVMRWLDAGRTEDPTILTAKTFFISTWAYGIRLTPSEQWSVGLKDTVRTLFFDYGEAVLDIPLKPYYHSTSNILASEAVNSPFGATLELRPTIGFCVEALAARQALYESFEQFMVRIGNALDSEVVMLRTKALKALQGVFVADSSVLGYGNMRKLLEARMMDLSTSVRDAAIELVGKFLISGDKQLIKEYYPIISDRIMDVGVNVRKRIVKLLRDIYMREVKLEGDDDKSIVVDIIVKLLGRLVDEENSVKDLAFKSLQEIWFTFNHSEVPGFGHEAHSLPCKHEPPKWASWSSLSTSTRSDIRKRALLMVEAVASHANAPNLFGNLVRRCLLDTGKVDRNDIMNVCRTAVECLIEEILCLEERSCKVAIKDILSLLQEFSAIFPTLIAPHLKTLQPYLKGPVHDGGTEQKIAQIVIVIIHNIISVIQHPDLDEWTSIEVDLTTALNKGSQQLVAVAVPCLCAIVANMTRHYHKLTKVLKTCIDFTRKTEAAVMSKKNVPAGAWRMTWRCLLIVAQLARYYDFDGNRAKLGEPALKDLREITSGSILNAVCELVLFFLEPRSEEGTKAIALTALGHLFMAYPRLMLRDDVRSVMNVVFAGQSILLKVNLLKVFLDFLKNEQQKDAQKKDNAVHEHIDIKVLIGNAEEMAEAGISSSVMQTYLDRMLDCLLSSNLQLMRVAFEVTELILEQGLVHPLLCMPPIVALEANPVPEIRDRALRLHEYLAEKHASFIHAKNMDCVKQMYEYVSALTKATEGEIKIGSSTVMGYFKIESVGDGGTITSYEAMLGRMYSLIQGIRPRRNEFLMNMVKLLDVPLTTEAGHMMDIDYCRFVAENLALFEYKTQEEVLQVIYHAYRALSVGGETILRYVESLDDVSVADEGKEMPLLVVAKASLGMGMLLLLQTHLQNLYALSSARVSGYRPNDGPRSAEKPAARASGAPLTLSWERMPFAKDKVMSTEADYRKQCRKFKELIDADYRTSREDVEPREGEEAQFATATPDKHSPRQMEDGSPRPSDSKMVTKRSRTANGDTTPRRRSSATKRKSKSGAKGGRGISVTPTKRKRKSIINVSSDEMDTDNDPDFILACPK